jgi:hypothetical protein
MLAWINHQVVRDPLRLFDANILHPIRRSLAFGDSQILPSLLGGPVYWVSGNPILAYNLSVALACLLAAFAMRYLARILGANAVGAFAAGALYAFHTYQINEAARLQIVFHGFVPLALAELLIYMKTGRRKHLWLMAACMLAQSLSCNYHLLYGSFLIALVLILFLLAAPRATVKKIPALAGAAAVTLLFYAPVAYPYFRNAADFGYLRAEPQGIDLVHYFSTTPTNLLYGAMGTEVRLQQRGPHFIGFTSIALAGIALGAWIYKRRYSLMPRSLISPAIWVPAAAALALLFVVLSLGRDFYAFGKLIGPGPYRLLYEYVPGFRLVRIPERMSFLAMLFIALLVARGLTLMASWGLKAPALVLAVLVPLEHLSPLPVTERLPVGREMPVVYSWLAGDPAQAVAEVPIHGERLIRKETLESYFSTLHFKPLIHGYTAYPPLLSSVMRRMAEQFPMDVSLYAFSKTGVDTVIVHRGRSGDETLAIRLHEVVAAGHLQRIAVFAGKQARVYEGTIDEVYRVVSASRIAAAPFPNGRRRLDPTWRYRTKAGEPLPATDGRMETAWEVRRALNGDEFFEITFEKPIETSGLVLRLRQDSLFPTRFKVGGREPDGRWVPVAFYDSAHQIQLLERLLADPGDTVLGFDWEDRELTGLILMLDEGGKSPLGWSIPEVEVWVPNGTPDSESPPE